MTSLLRVADEDYVRIFVPADDSELFAVPRPIEVPYKLRLEVREYFSGRTVKRLEPDIVGIAIASGVSDGFAIRCERDGGVNEGCKLRARTFEFYKPRRLAGIEWQQHKLLFGVSQAKGDKSSELSVRGEGDAAKNLQLGKLL